MPTITVDAETYRLLTAEKRKGESFSKVIKRQLRPERSRARTCTARELLEHLRGINISEDALDRMDEIVEARKESPIDAPDFDLGD